MEHAKGCRCGFVVYLSIFFLVAIAFGCGDNGPETPSDGPPTADSVGKVEAGADIRNDDVGRRDSSGDGQGADLGIPDGPGHDAFKEAMTDAACFADATQSCYTGPAGTDGIGECKAGTQICSSGQWSACVGQAVPSSELCDSKDNDCDSTTDEDFTNLGQSCSVGIGECKAVGVYQCKADNSGTECSASSGTPSSEQCDGKDNDCDGKTDKDIAGNPLSQSCYTGPSGTSGIGQCKTGTQSCSAGTWGTCSGETVPTTDICNGFDDDCDATSDEDFTDLNQSCAVGVGECTNTGTYQCKADGSGTECSAKPGTPGTETCDNKDNDCDGSIDGSLTQSCYSGPVGTQGVGLCKTGSQTCSAGSWGACTGEVKPATEICDGLDNDCDGSADESLVQSCYAGPSGTQGVGLCKAGAQTCASGTWGTCAGQITPTTELCDNKDNDCDGTTDESVTQSCYTGPSGTQGVGLCKAGTQTCTAGSWGTCSAQVTPTIEICDGKDNDCDGSIDENLVQSCYTGPSGTQGVGL